MAAPWYVAAGWALELFLGEERREHEDTEVGVPEARFGEVADALAGYELFVPRDGALVPFDGSGHQTWVRDPAADVWRLDVFREPSAGDVWICRRDPAIRLPSAELIERTADGIPFLRPEIVLLFKAKATRPKDEDDFTAVLPRLGAGRRAWLYDALARVHSGHAWLEQL